MENIFKTIQGALATIPDFKWIEADNGQINLNPENEAPIIYPAALIKIDENIPYKKIAGGKRLGILNFYVKYVFKPLEGTHHLAPAEIKEKALIPYAVQKKANTAVLASLARISLINSRSEQGKSYFALHNSFTYSFIDTK
ncbi:MAG: hypothetical protein PHE56_16150 [Bacteroidales bacterium]|nr:hypothetical protein [Bacteroidales bacterium]